MVSLILCDYYGMDSNVQSLPEIRLVGICLDGIDYGNSSDTKDACSSSQWQENLGESLNPSLSWTVHPQRSFSSVGIYSEKTSRSLI